MIPSLHRDHRSGKKPLGGGTRNRIPARGTRELYWAGCWPQKSMVKKAQIIHVTNISTWIHIYCRLLGHWISRYCPRALGSWLTGPVVATNIYKYLRNSGICLTQVPSPYKARSCKIPRKHGLADLHILGT